MALDFTGRADVGAPPERVYPLIADLATYPHWLGIVHSAEPDGEGAWLVEIGARVGPFTRTKRLRMAVAGVVPGQAVRFERQERDGRDHAAWSLEADVAGAARTRVTVRLHYAGGVPLPGIDRLLAVEARRAGPRLDRLLAREAD